MSSPKYIQASNDIIFTQRVRYHMIKAAVAIANEDVNTTNHEKRVKLASAVLAGSFNVQTAVSLTLVNWVIEALADPLDATEINIADAVAGFWDALALTV